MLFKQLIDEFLDKWDKDTAKAYRKKIYSFYQYLVEMRNATDSNYKSILKGLEIEDVAESIIFSNVIRLSIEHQQICIYPQLKAFMHIFLQNRYVPIYILIIKCMHQR